MSSIAQRAIPSLQKVTEFRETLAPRLQGELRIDSMSRALYATDASMYQRMPLAVLIPRSTDDVQAAIEESARFNIPILPRGGGSSLAGQTVNEALVIDFSLHLNELVELRYEEKTVRVQPGLVLDPLNTRLARHGLMVGPDPASSNRATIGGMVGNNATGTHSILYGNMIRHVRSVKAFLDDGTPVHFESLDQAAWEDACRRSGREGEIYRGLDELIATRAAVIERDTPRHWRRNSGYRLEELVDPSFRNVAGILCGSEGTLAVTSQIELALVHRPQKTALAVVHFRTMRESLEAVTTILETDPSAVELFDGIAIEQTRRAPGFAHRLTFIDGEPGAVLIVEYYGSSDRELSARIEDLKQKLARTRQSYAIVPARTPIEVSNVWVVRKEGLGLIMGVEGDHKPMPFIEDASVPVEHLAEYVTELQRSLAGTPTVYYAHASAGTLHIRPFINTKDAGDVEKMRDIALASMELVRRFGGAVSSEHGDGIARSWLLEPLVGKELYEAHITLKDIFDPARQLNPGNVVEAPPMTDHLRMGPAYTSIPILEELDFSGQGGFARAVELCNGNGACRKLENGTMCPSYMVTLEEGDSTRGRANALRMAMSGAMPPEEFTGDRLYDVMDLCIQCKGCKTECPSNVDMAKIKTEWLSKYWEANSLPMRARFFTRMPALARRLGGPAARTINWMNTRKAFRKMLERSVGISSRRVLPAFAVEPFTKWFERQRWESDGPSVVLFADTFNNFNHPETARAAAEFLKRIGYSVQIAEARLCCGRPHLSKGLIREARNLALEVVDALHPYALEGMPIIGLEPSCILTFRDEFLSLLPGDTRASELAEVAVTFEEFVTHLHRTDALGHVRWTDETRDILLHGHCHQKALVGTGPSEISLSIPPNYRVNTVDSGCCGMAGSFGYEAEHYEISIAMAERRLAPAVRAVRPETIIAAAGTSCRAQIHDTTGRTALHPAEILRNALA